MRSTQGPCPLPARCACAGVAGAAATHARPAGAAVGGQRVLRGRLPAWLTWGAGMAVVLGGVVAAGMQASQLLQREPGCSPLRIAAALLLQL
jgi:hypothetical protein